jgi:ATP-dependent DNA helicase
MVIRDRKYLTKFHWKYLVVDEGHRVKNFNCKLLKDLRTFSSANRLLLTGTPLQNNLRELWSMLNFLLPDIFDDVDSFERWFDFSSIGDKSGNNQIIEQEQQNQIVTKLHDILRPFLLRRLKTDVELELPKKQEKLVFTGLSKLQTKYYKAVLEKNLDKVLSPEAQKQLKNSGSSLQNMLMQLRKVCNHPFLFEWPTNKKGEDIIDESLISSSGKMMVLDRLLSRLFQEGHKVLIFSQMTRMLDILEDYLTMRGYQYSRIDGSSAQQDREANIQTFNSRPDVFCFLLSTRAGGLGINLTAADTVIFYDNDWNPQMDLQAQDRCHRIGQTKPVKVYRLATANSIESRILERQSSKMKLEQLVIQKGNFIGVKSKSKISVDELQELLESEKAPSDNLLTDVTDKISDEFLFQWAEQ